MISPIVIHISLRGVKSHSKSEGTIETNLSAIILVF